MFVVGSLLALAIILGMIAKFRESDDKDIKTINEEHSKKAL